MNERGLDALGYIANPVSVANIPEAFLPAFREAIERLTSEFGGAIHSIYLYGSVGRGDAIFGKSDLDLSIITHAELSAKQANALAVLEKEVCRNHQSISKLELDTGTYAEAMIMNAYEWQFWLKHVCDCAWSYDLRQQISPYKPSRKIGLEMNKDIQHRLDQALTNLTQDNFADIGKSIAKKIIRTHYLLFIEEDNSFHTNLDTITKTLLSYCPEQASNIREALALSKGNVRNRPQIEKIITSYGAFVSAQILPVSDSKPL